MKGNLVIGQSGGPTAVINASLAGVISEAKKHSNIDGIYGMRFGIEGFLEGKLIDLRAESESTLKLLKDTPSSALGSCRMKLANEQLPAVLEMLKRFNIRYFFYIGGDDSQNTTHRVVEYCKAQGYELHGIGIPKTVDNDLYGTDHTPGYGSAARYVALSTQQGGRLAYDMRRVDPVLVYQAVGRDAGWLAAAAALARQEEIDPPHLIYVPERPLTKERLISDIEKCYERFGLVSIVVGEGIVWTDGSPVSGTQVFDKFGNPEFGAGGGASAAMVIKNLACDHLNVRGEFQIVESLQMAGMDRVSIVDRDEAFMAGEEAVRLAASGKTGLMVAFERDPGPKYVCKVSAVPLTRVNEGKQRMPDKYLDDENSYVTPEFLDYLRPLVGPDLPQMARLAFTPVK
ncbi:MAG: Pyrophosphate--fructose 6-phosphate 1-phosphotransferase [Deltaproteobacteria bacterium ADurb.Bin058]|nr:MAG: Pyrophosphate--fructose 6-phosphate 1-phosphotransferase [Deltaproteobacteria bacterium ADurb.Bin058]